MTAVQRAQEMLRVPIKDLPPLAVAFAQHISGRLGGCIEVYLTAYAVYAQMVEKLPNDDDLYDPLHDPLGVLWWKDRGYVL